MKIRKTRRSVWPATVCSLVLSILVLSGMVVEPLYSAVGDIGDQKVVRVPLDGWSPGETLDIHNLAGRMILSGGGAPSLTVTFHAEASGGLGVDDILELVDVRAEKAADGFKVTTVLPLDRFSSYAYPEDAAKGTANTGDGIVATIGSWFGGFSSSSGTFDGKRVKVIAKGGSGTLAVWADYLLVVPEGSRVTMNNFVGVLDIHQANGEFRLDTGSGDVKAAAVKGVLEVDTGSGDVEVKDFSGSNLAMDTGSGDITAVRVSAEKLLADTGSGDVALSAFSGGHCVVDTGSGDVTVDCDLLNCSKMLVDTGSGDVVLALSPNAPFSLRADTGSGDVTGAVQGASQVMDDDELVGFDRGSGGTSIMVDTGSGDVVIKNR